VSARVRWCVCGDVCHTLTWCVAHAAERLRGEDADGPHGGGDEREDPRQRRVLWILRRHRQNVRHIQHTPTHTHDTTRHSRPADDLCDRWNAFTAKCTATLAGHTGWVNCLHLDHEKERLVSGSYDKFLKLYAPTLCRVCVVSCRVCGMRVSRVRCVCGVVLIRAARHARAHAGGICIGRARSGR
jgi:hypothetical protein